MTGVPCQAQQPSAQSLLMDRKKGRVPVIGQTKDCKYPVYDLKGDLNDLTYFSRDGDTVWPPGVLLGRMVFLDPSDLKTGAYQCDYVCKDKAGRIVGMNPSYKSSLKKK